MGKSSLLLERREDGAGLTGMISISGFETISGCISDSGIDQRLLRYASVETYHDNQ